MHDADKTKEHLMAELAALRQRVAILEATEAEHTRVEAAFQESERRYRHLMEHSLGLLCIHDLDGIILEVNPAAAEALGYHPRDGVGRSLREFLAAAVQHQFEAYLERIRQHPMDSGLMRVMTRDGEERVWLYRNVRYAEPGKPPYVLGHALDVTERVQAEQVLKQVHDELEQQVAQRTAALQESEAQFRDLIDGSMQGIMIHSQGRPLFVNHAFARIFGYGDPQDILALNTADLIVPQDRERLHRLHDDRLAGKETPIHYEYQGLRKDGSVVWLDSVARVVTWKGHPAVQIVVFDITDRRQAEEALRQSEKRYRTLVETIPHGIQENDPSGLITFSNEAHAKMHGYAKGELLGTAVWDLLASETELDELRSCLARLVQEQPLPTPYVTRDRTKDGRTIDVQVDWNYKRDAHGRVTGFISVISDITERKRLEDRLRQAHKMEAVGTLAGGIAHEFNNVLGAILGFTDLTQYAMPQGSVAWQNLQEVLKAGRRAKDLVQQILAFSRLSDEVREPLSLPLGIQEVLVLLRASLPTTIEIHQHLPEEGGTVLANRTHLYQIVMNLCTNAEYAMRETGGILTLAVDNVEVDDAFAASHPVLQPGPHVRLTVRDTGHGMRPDVVERIFDPFFTTKDMGEGTGMGLAIVHGIVTGHGGAITVESTPGEGTTFTIYLPRLADAAVGDTDHPEEDIPLGKRHILFVDDDEALARLGEHLLEQLGYDVVSKTSSIEALEAFCAEPHRFDLVFTDQTMPHMTGETLTRELRRIRPDIPVILCTGFSHVMDAEKAQAIGIDAFCMKPLVARDLAVTIQQVLAQRAEQTTPPLS
jgi:PAS domain S-box-containing protein